MSLTASRRLARKVIADVRSRQAWAHDVLSERIRRSQMSDADIAFATRIVYGAIGAEGTLDEVLDRHLDRPARLHPLARDALRIAAYELLFMRTPAPVVVDQGVENVREVARSAAGLANAVLRKIAEEAESFPWGDPATDMAALARSTGHPQWLAGLLEKDLGGARAREVMHSALEPAPLYLAHNPFRSSYESLLERLTEEGVGPREYGPVGCIEATSSAAAVRSGALEAGECLVADAAAQFVAALAGIAPGQTGVDVAAGRGTKTLLMQASAARRGGAGSVLAADIHPFKTSLLQHRMRELGVPGVRSVTADATDPASISELGGEASADVVLVDAPCSGIGTLRRHPEKRWRLKESDIESVATVSEGMLRVAARLVRPSGIMVFSTCTVTRRENEDVVSGFLESSHGAGFSTAGVAEQAPAGWERFVTDEGWFASHPVVGGPDGHFAAVLMRV